MRRKISRARASRLARTLASTAGVSPGAGMAAENGDAPPRAQGAGGMARPGFPANPGRVRLIPTIERGEVYDGLDWSTPGCRFLILRRWTGGAGARSAAFELEMILLVVVRDDNVDQALKYLKKKMQREGVFREMKLRKATRSRRKRECARRPKRSAGPASSRARRRSARA